jgi:hypothetical protein
LFPLERAAKFARLTDTKPQCCDSEVAGRVFAGFNLRLIQMQIVKQRNVADLG